MSAPTVADVRARLDELESSGALSMAPTDWGPRLWGVLHDVVEIVPCATCRDEGRVMVEGLHDIVNVARGKAPERPRALCALAAQATAAATSTGRCRVAAVRGGVAAARFR